MTDEELNEIDARANAATPGKWREEYAYNNGGMPTCDFYIPGHTKEAHVEMLATDAVFIVASRDDVPALVAEVRRLKALVHQQELFGLGAVELVAAIEENRQTFRWVNAPEDYGYSLRDSRGLEAGYTCTMGGKHAAAIRGKVVSYNHATAKEAMAATEAELRNIHTIRPFDVVVPWEGGK